MGKRQRAAQRRALEAAQIEESVVDHAETIRCLRRSGDTASEYAESIKSGAGSREYANELSTALFNAARALRMAAHYLEEGNEPSARSQIFIASGELAMTARTVCGGIGSKPRDKNVG